MNDGDEAPIEPEPEGPDEAERRSTRRWRIAAVVAVVAALVAMGVVAALLVRAGSSSPARTVMACIPDRDFTGDGSKRAKCPPKGAEPTDGLIQEATDTGFELVTVDGQRRSFTVRPADRPYIDVQHAQTHASLGQPIRIYTERVGGDDVIVYMVDSPLRF